MQLWNSVRSKIKIVLSSLYSLAGSFIIALGWSWYHFSKHPRGAFIKKTALVWLAVVVGYYFFKLAYIQLVRYFKRHEFWEREFSRWLDALFFTWSLLFVIFFFRNEVITLIYESLIFLLLWRQLQYYLARHPDSKGWLTVNKNIFILAYFIFLVSGASQYLAHRYYILDSQSKFYNIVFFRSWAMTMFWLAGFAVAGFIYLKLTGAARYLAAILWSVLFTGGMLLWSVNIGILYFSGLYFNPAVLPHIGGSGGVVWGGLTWILLAAWTTATAVFILIVRKMFYAERLAPRRCWYFFLSALLAVALVSLFGLASFKNTPERVVARSFYRYFIGETKKIKLDPAIKQKLERFGLYYEPNKFYVSRHEQIYNSAAKLLPDKFLTAKPNILIVFLESFSARLSDAYNPRFTDLTPGLDAMAADSHATVFKHYYNASTPTVTGLLSQLCSFLPPTGHNEIENEGHWQNHHLLCLPRVLKEQAGFAKSLYITAVRKDFANKDKILGSMGNDEVYGTDELKKYITDPPLSWGYSDHQMFPVVWRMMNEEKQEPFLMMLSTVDTHLPFNLAKDEVKYRDGGNALLNAYHTTDDAFGKFWAEFKQSRFYNNTIVITIADHASFPSSALKDLFPEEAKSLSFYDENYFTMYIPDSILPRQVDRYSSGIDFTPTLLQIFGINIPNSFDGHSIFGDREKFPNLLGMHELGLYINQFDNTGKRKIDYNVPGSLECLPGEDSAVSSTNPLTPCEYLQFYQWKRQMLEEGRLWYQD